MHSIDIFVQNYFSLVRTEHLTEFMYLLTTLFDFYVPFVLVSLCTAGLIYFVRNYRYAILFLTSLISGTVLVYLLKIFFNVNRPPDAVMSAFGQSLPSYHATMATIFFVMLMYIFDSHFKTPGRIVLNTFCISMIILVAFSRIYLGVHWTSDVLFGIFLGTFLSIISIKVFKSLKK